MASRRKYSAEFLADLAERFASVYVPVDDEGRLMVTAQAGNFSATARAFGLSSQELAALIANHDSVSRAYRAAEEAYLDFTEAALLQSAILGNKGGQGTIALKVLQARRSDKWKPVERVEDVTGYRAPSEDEKRSSGPSGGSGRTLTVLNGGLDE